MTAVTPDTQTDYLATQVNPCATCGACCSSYIVPVNGYDMWLLSTRQRISPEQYLVACPQEDPGFDGFRLDAERPPYGLALDKQGKFDPMQPCVFLMRLGDGHTRCGIYGERPSVCRAYPMTVWNMEMSQMQTSLCPPGAWPPGEPRRPHWRMSLQRLYMHSDIYHEVVARWNGRLARLLRSNPEARFGLPEYFSYVLNVYDKLNVLWTELGEEHMQAVQANWPMAPRPAIELDKVQLRGGELPWLDHLLLCREVIDTFFPEVEPQPILALRPIDTKAEPSPRPGAKPLRPKRQRAANR